MSKIEELNNAIERELERWNDYKVNGGSDPFWPDGTNMNLIRNHIIYYLYQIADLQNEPMQLSFLDVAGETVDPKNDKRIPPKVNEYFMAKERPIHMIPSERAKLVYHFEEVIS